MHGRCGNGVSKQLAAEGAVNAFVHVVEELCVFIVTCVNIEAAVLFTDREHRKGLCFVADCSTTRVTRNHNGQSTNCPQPLPPPLRSRRQSEEGSNGCSPGVKLSQPRLTSSFPITLTARLNADVT